MEADFSEMFKYCIFNIIQQFIFMIIVIHINKIVQEDPGEENKFWRPNWSIMNISVFISVESKF